MWFSRCELLLLSFCLLLSVARGAPVFRSELGLENLEESASLEDRSRNAWLAETHVGGDDVNFAKYSRDPYFDAAHLEEQSKLAKPDLTDCLPMAKLSRIAYCRNMTTFKTWECPDCADPALKDFKVFRKFFNPKWDLFGYIGYFPETNAKVIAFRGTDSSSLWNWVEDLSARRTSAPIDIPGLSGAYVHAGFGRLWKTSGMEQNMTEALADLISIRGWDGPLYVTGHSMGAALAHLCAMYMHYMFTLTDVRVFTFGSPRVGNQDFYRAFDRMVSVSKRFTHMADIVPSVPTQWMGYHHVSTEIFQIDHFDEKSNTTHIMYKKCDGSGEDPTCHASMCAHGVCRSILDHYTYMGISMMNPYGAC